MYLQLAAAASNSKAKARYLVAAKVALEREAAAQAATKESPAK
jgi:hypothetical protein